MSIILRVNKVESSEGDRSSKYERTNKLMLIYSDMPKKAITKDSKFSYYLSTSMNPTCCKYTLQRRQGQHCGFQFYLKEF